MQVLLSRVLSYLVQPNVAEQLWDTDEHVTVTSELCMEVGLPHAVLHLRSDSHQSTTAACCAFGVSLQVF